LSAADRISGSADHEQGKTMSRSPTMHLPGVQSAGRLITDVYENAHEFPPWAELVKPRTLVLADQAVCDCAATRAAVGALDKIGDVVVERVQAGEPLKQRPVLAALVQKVCRFAPDHVVIVGGGTVINLGLFAACEFVPGRPGEAGERGRCSILPTNTMAIADVALGGLGLLNGPDGHKNAERCKRDPDFIFLFSEYVENSPVDVRREGIVEVLKHCILQREPLIRDTLRRYLAADLDAEAAFAAAKLGLALKSDVMRLGAAWSEDNIEFVLSYGHLHAHVIEEHWEGRVPHSYCVFVGLLLDLLLSGADALARAMAEAARASALSARFGDLLKADVVAAYLAEYPTEGRFWAGENDYYVLNMNAQNLGRLVSANLIGHRFKVPLSSIKHAYDTIRPYWE
jgi:3-dehydroquinate synthetase